MKLYKDLDVISFEHKGYTIKVYEQEPEEAWKKYVESDWCYNDLRGDELGSYAYKIYNAQGECLIIDRCCMGDEEACIENAKGDIDCGACLVDSFIDDDDWYSIICFK